MSDPTTAWKVTDLRGSRAAWVLRAGPNVIVSAPECLAVAESLRRRVTADPAVPLDDLSSVLSEGDASNGIALVRLGEPTVSVLSLGAITVAPGEAASGSFEPVMTTAEAAVEVRLGEVDPDGSETCGVEVAPARDEPTGVVQAVPDQPVTDQADSDAARGFQLLALDEPDDEELSPLDPLPSVSSTVLPEVERAVGKRCAVDHFNHPDARYCVQCGRGFDPGGSVIASEAPRPPIGVVIDGNGRRVEIDEPIVIGRVPDRDPDVRDGRATPMVTDVEDASRVHARLVTEGWDLFVVDLSTNGTSRLAAGGHWERLPKDRRVKLEPGDRIRVGVSSDPAATLRFISHHIDNKP